MLFRSFHHPTWIRRRMNDCEKIANHLKTQGEDTTWWENVKRGKQDPWQKLVINDINKQMVQFELKKI